MTDITPTESPRSVAVIGLGAMGAGMARRLAAAGHRVTLWNRTSTRTADLAAEIGATAGATPAAAAADADVVLAMVRDDEASHAVWLGADGALEALAVDTIAVDASTLTPGWVAELEHAVTSHGARFLEAPVIGSRPQVAAGALVSLVGGSPDALDHARPVLDAYSGGVRHCGAVGSAAVTKLAVNGLFATQVALFAETVGLLGRAGMAAGEATAFLGGLPITSPGLERILGLIATGDHSPNFPIELVAKDLGYLVSTAARLDAPMPVAAQAADVFASAVDDVGELDIAGIAARYV
ncbi:MAG: NAD(P)-dependent oxidoreductase [Actinomycetota bacterium]